MQCAACGRQTWRAEAGAVGGGKLRTCGRCGLVRYCSAGCQKMHWSERHKRECTPPGDSEAGAGSSVAAAPHRACSRQALVLAFAASGSSTRQREASWAGLLPPEMHAIILKQLPVTDYASITGVVGTVGNGIGVGPGQFDNTKSMSQVSFGSDSTLWAVDMQGHRVHHFKQSGELIKTIGTGTGGNSPGELGSPVGVAVSRLSSSIFIGEHGNNRISEFNQIDGTFVRVLLDTSGRMVGPYGIGLSPDETTLAVACLNGHCIHLVSVDGSVASRSIGAHGNGDGQLRSPVDVRFTPDGQQLAVADQWNDRVQCFALDGSVVRKIPLGAQAIAVAVDVTGNIVAATTRCIDRQHRRQKFVPRQHVKVLSPEGTLLHDRLGGLEMGDAAPGGLAIDPFSGRIAMGDMQVGKVHLM